MSTLPMVAIIILNWRQSELTLACLESVKCLTYNSKRLQIVVVDNASKDGSVEAIRDAYPGVTVIENPDNLGYAGGNNVGIRWALSNGATYILILNNDTILDPGLLNRLIVVMEDDKAIGITGPLIFHAEDPGVIQSAGGRLDKKWRGWHEGENERDEGQYDTCRQVEWLSGCALLARVEAVRQAGTFDERFFSYWEDVDWCLRISQAGWQVLNVPSAKIWHKGVQRNYQPKAYVTYYMTRNKLLTLKKHHAPVLVWLFTLFGMFKTIISWSVKSGWGSKISHRNAMLRGMTDFFMSRWGRAELSE